MYHLRQIASVLYRMYALCLIISDKHKINITNCNIRCKRLFGVYLSKTSINPLLRY